MPRPLEGRTVLVTGASSGIGAAVARALAPEGARLILAARREDRLAEVAASLGSAEYLSVTLDVRDREAVEDTLEHLPEDWRAIDALVNSAGLSRGLAPIQQGSHEDWDEMIDTNVKGLLHVTRAVLPGMVERGRGHVVNIGSIAGHEAYARGNVYCATKAAVEMLTRTMRLDLNGTGVKVTTVDPGMVETEFSVVRFRGDAEKAASVYKGMTPLTADDIADAVRYALTRPAHVQIAEIILFPTDQSSASTVHRRNG